MRHENNTEHQEGALENNFDLPQLEQEADYWVDTTKKRIESEQSANKLVSAHQKEVLEKFKGIHKTIEALGNILSPGDDPIAFLEERINNLQAKWKNVKDNNEADELEKEWKSFEQTAEFIIKQSQRPESSPHFIKWQKEQKEEVQQQKTSNDNPDIATEARLEKVKEQMLINEIKKSGGVALNTSLPKEYSPEKNSGFQNVFDNKIKNPKFYFQQGNMLALDAFSSTLGHDAGREMQERKIHEAVAVTPMEQANWVDVEKTVGKKFGFIPSKKKEIIKENRGTKPVFHAELIPGGKENEQVYKISYSVQGILSQNRELGYKDYSGRVGQYLRMEILVPKTTAEEFLQRLKDNPTLIRELAKIFAIENTEISEETWEKGDEHTNGHPLKPPYELWDKQADRKGLYLQEPSPDGKFVAEELSIKKS